MNSSMYIDDRQTDSLNQVDEDLRTSSPQSVDILIVDDIPDNIRFLSKFLVEQGYRVRKAVNGQMALTAIQTLIPDLILLDINLPDLNGYEICTLLKGDRSTQSIPIIFLSAGNEAIDKIKAFQLGASDYITKPFYLEEVLARIQTQLTIQGLQKELESQNFQLKHTLEALKVSQAHLVQQEKMATLRKVVAGVAHEINNPLSFIACNVRPAQEYVQSLTALVDLYQQQYPNPSPAISEYLESIDLDFITADLSKVLHSMETGAERIRAVILALQFFTRLDEAGLKVVDVHDSIENAFIFLQNRLTSREDAIIIQVDKVYAKLPQIKCYADQLNQAIFNILCNAIDAIDEKLRRSPSESFQPQLSIYTRMLNEHSISITIKDNGVGIPDANKSSIFEPFFTTKIAGQGVGLGLAISRRIIEEIHGGQLTYESIHQEGSEFTITIPME